MDNKEKEEVNNTDNKKELDSVSKEKVENIIKKAKENGQLTYKDLATELEGTDPENIDKVFDTFEEMGVDILKDDDVDIEPDLEDLREVEEIKIEDLESSFLIL